MNLDSCSLLRWPAWRCWLTWSRWTTPRLWKTPRAQTSSTFALYINHHPRVLFLLTISLIFLLSLWMSWHWWCLQTIQPNHTPFCPVMFSSVSFSIIVLSLSYLVFCSTPRWVLIGRRPWFPAAWDSAALTNFCPKRSGAHTYQHTQAYSSAHKPSRVHTNRQKLSRRTYTNIQDEGPHGSRQLQAKGNGHSLHCYATKTPQIAFTFSLGQPFSFNIS